MVQKPNDHLKFFLHSCWVPPPIMC
jgi:hypothetical protein